LVAFLGGPTPQRDAGTKAVTPKRKGRSQTRKGDAQICRKKEGIMTSAKGGQRELAKGRASTGNGGTRDETCTRAPFRDNRLKPDYSGRKMTANQNKETGDASVPEMKSLKSTDDVRLANTPMLKGTSRKRSKEANRSADNHKACTVKKRRVSLLGVPNMSKWAGAAKKKL